ncbi:MAG: hypothetical protein J5973_09020 [Eubacterium sp.]|nr:hypothetical protein [Eubacterium sp.]
MQTFSLPKKGCFQRNALELGMQIHSAKHFYKYYDYSLFHMMQVTSQSLPLKDLAHPLIIALNSSSKDQDAAFFQDNGIL